MPFWSKWKPLKALARALTPPAEVRRQILAEAQHRIEKALLEALKTPVAQANIRKARDAAAPIVQWLDGQVE